MKCIICDREAGEKKFCVSHLIAYENIVKNYDVWKKAVEIHWKEYLREVVKNPLTGEWVKEVAEQLIKIGGKENVAES
jgi:hypothetical protein